MGAIARVEQPAAADFEYTHEQRELIRRQLCPEASDDELDLFLGQCRRTRLDPFSRQIYARMQWNSGQGRKVMVVQVGIDGLRLVAQRTGEADGHDGPYWCGPDGEWKDVWLSDAPPAAAKVMVYRKGCARPFPGIATYREYCQRNKSGQPAGLWATMPANQLAKCAEALGTRKAFSQDTSGLYVAEEMDQADNAPAIQTAETTRQLPPPDSAKLAQARDALSAQVRDEFVGRLNTARTLDVTNLIAAEVAGRRGELLPADFEQVVAAGRAARERLTPKPAPAARQPHIPGVDPDPDDGDGAGEDPAGAINH